MSKYDLQRSRVPSWFCGILNSHIQPLEYDEQIAFPFQSPLLSVLEYEAHTRIVANLHPGAAAVPGTER